MTEQPPRKTALAASAKALLRKLQGLPEGSEDEAGEEERASDEADEEEGDSGEDAASSPEEVEYSEETSFEASDASDGDDDAPVSVQVCNDCGEERERGRVDETDGVWYCEQCWAYYAQREENDEKGDASSQHTSDDAHSQYSSERQGAGTSGSPRSLEGEGEVEATVGPCADSVQIPARTSECCSTCGISEVGGHKSAAGLHFCDWCWAEGCGSAEATTGLISSGPSVCGLPIEEFRDEIIASIRKNTVTSIQGETGCGKSSMVPLFILEDCEAARKRVNIFVTQPRRLAAITLAQRVAHQRREAVGRTVGYRVGNGDHQQSKNTKIVFCTVGYLLAFLSHNPEYFSSITHLLLDEVHERSVDADSLNFLIKKMMESHPVKLVVMSATLQTGTFGQYFTPPSEFVTSPIFVGARRFEVQRIFLDSLATELSKVDEGLVSKAIARFCSSKVVAKLSNEAKKLVVQCIEAVALKGSTTLVFLPGMDEICEVQEEIYKRALLQISVHVLHSQVPQEDQDKSLAPPPAGMRKVILATNIAESSITIPDVETVIDSGLVRGMFFDDQRGMQCLLSKWCSRASIRQRAGRAGRVREGTVIQLMTQAFHDRLGEFDEAPILKSQHQFSNVSNQAEILRTPLTKTVLNVKLLFRRFGSPSDVLSHFVAPPPPSRVRAAIEELYRAGATSASTEDAEVTALGEAATKLPVDLPLCKLILLGTAMAVSNAAIVMAAALSLDDVFALPMTLFIPNAKDFTREVAANYGARCCFDRGQYSEPIMYLQLFEAWLASSRDAAWCRQKNLSWQRMRQLDGMVASLASGSKQLLSQHNLIPDLLDKLEGAARNRTRLTEKEAEIICRQGSDLQVHRFILAGAFSPLFLVGEASTGMEREVVHCKMDPRKTVVISDIEPKETLTVTLVAALQDLLQVAGPGSGHGCAIRIAKSKELSPGQLLIELHGSETIGRPEGAYSRWNAVAEDVTHPVKLLLQLYKQNRGKLRVPNPKFVVGGDEPEHIRIGKIAASRTLAWRWGLNTKAVPSSRQPVCQMSDFSDYASQRLATAFSLIGSESTKLVNANGMSVFPAGAFGDFLRLAFAQRDEEVRVLCRRNDEMMTLEAALCSNVALEFHSALDMDVVNFFRRDIVSKAMAGQLVSAQDRRRGKQLLAEIVKNSELPAHCAETAASEWINLYHDRNSDDYFPEWHFQAAAHASPQSEWPALDQDSSFPMQASIWPCGQPQGARSRQQRSSEARLVQVLDQTIAPVLNARQMSLSDLNSMLQSSPAVIRAAMQCHGDKSEICILGTLMDQRPGSLIFKRDLSSGGRLRIVAMTPALEEKLREAANHAPQKSDIQPGSQEGQGGDRGLGGDSIESPPAAREIVTALGMCIGFFCREDQEIAAASSQWEQGNAGRAEAHSSPSSPGASGALSHPGGGGEAPSMQTGEIDPASMRELSHRDGNVDAEGYLGATSPATAEHEGQDAHLRLQLEAAIMMLGLSSEDPHALPTAGTDGLLGKGPVTMLGLSSEEPHGLPRAETDGLLWKGPVQKRGDEESSNRLAGRVRTLENALRTMLRVQDMTLEELNRKVLEDTDLSRLTQELFCEYEARNEAKRQSSARGIRESIRENPLEENGALKAVFFHNRKALFCWRPTGLKWQRIGAVAPKQARVLTNPNLSAALSERTMAQAVAQRRQNQPRPAAEFTREEWAAFGVEDLRVDDYVWCGNSYFQPADVLFGTRTGEQEQLEENVISVVTMAASLSHQSADQDAIPKIAGPGLNMRSRTPSQQSSTLKAKDVAQAEVLHRGVQLENGWQEWKAPDGRSYYFHPDSQVSQWEAPEGVGKGVGILKQQATDAKTESIEEKNNAMRALETKLVTILQRKELDLTQVNKRLQDDLKSKEVLRKLCEYAKANRSRDLGLEKNGTLNRIFFDARPHLFKTRLKGSHTCVLAVPST